MTYVRNYFRHALIVLGLGFSANNNVSGVEYLITSTAGSTVTSGTLAADLNYTQYDAPQADQTYYIRLSYTSAEATTWGSIFSGNFDISIGDTTFGLINTVSIDNPGGIWQTTNVVTATANQQYYGNLVSDSSPWTPDSSPPPTTIHYLTLGQFDLKSVSTQNVGTTQINVAVVGGAPSGIDYPGAWNTGGPQFTPNAAGFNINVTAVPEPSTYISAAMACAALSGVALKKRKAKKAVATA